MDLSRSPRHASLERDGMGQADDGVPGRPWVRVGVYAGGSLALAVGILLGLEWVHALNDPWAAPAVRFASLQADVLTLGGLIVWAMLLLLLALTGRLWVTAGLALAGTAFVAFADYFKMQLRNEPLYPSDVGYLKEVGLLVESVGIGMSLAMVAALAAIPAAAWGLGRLAGRAGGGRWATAAPGRRWIALRVVVGAIAGVVLLSAFTFNRPGNATREAYEAAGVHWAPWSQADNYAKNGFVAGVLYNLPATAMDRPADYDAETMAALVERYAGVAAEINADRDVDALADTNIVLVLGESVADPMTMAGVEISQDPLPFLRELTAGATSGTMLTSGYGGGTANVEFEVLTGLAVANYQSQIHSPFQMLVSHRETFPSWLASLGEPERDTLTIHPYLPSFYRRSVVYPVFGFERSEFIDDMTHTSRMESDRHVSDKAAFAEVLDELRASDRPLLVNAVTMQNHGPQTGYSNPIDVTGPFTHSEAETMGQYLRGLVYTDAALEQLVADLATFEERTIVLYYGDHHPPLWPRAVLAANPPQAQYSTPYVVFANFETAEVDTATPIGPNLLVNQLLATANAPLTPYNALLEQLGEVVPAVETTMMLDSDGEIVGSEEELSPWARGLLADYRLIQYDLTVGAGYAAEALFEVPAG